MPSRHMVACLFAELALIGRSGLLRIEEGCHNYVQNCFVNLISVLEADISMPLQ